MMPGIIIDRGRAAMKYVAIEIYDALEVRSIPSHQNLHSSSGKGRTDYISSGATQVDNVAINRIIRFAPKRDGKLVCAIKIQINWRV